jgi:CHASE2 domain-containing sensor protein
MADDPTSTRGRHSEKRERLIMPKWILFGLVAVGQFVVAAAVFLYSGRVVIPVVIFLAGVCMTIAAVGEAMKKKT